MYGRKLLPFSRDAVWLELICLITDRPNFISYLIYYSLSDVSTVNAACRGKTNQCLNAYSKESDKLANVQVLHLSNSFLFAI